MITEMGRVSEETKGSGSGFESVEQPTLNI
jgi:hypothetical protein